MSTYTSFINHNFGGISKKDSRFAEDLITCSDMQNVELYFTELNSGVGIRTVKGNISVSNDISSPGTSLFPDDENIYGMFESNLNGHKYFIIYAESLNEGKLYKFETANEEHPSSLTLIVGGLAKTKKACATDIAQGFRDMFVFSNGIDIKYVYYNVELGKLDVEKDENINLTDPDNRTVRGLGMIAFDGRLFIFDERILWYSNKSDCRDFHTSSPNVITSAGYIEYVKPITAITMYLDSLAVFHSDSSSLLQQDPKTAFAKSEESPGGCASYNSLVFHGTDLFFYDDKKKGVFSFKQIINGDKTLGPNIAYDIQKELINIKNSDLEKIRSLSVVTSDRNEVWFILPFSDDERHSTVMIYDYIRDAWIKRKCQKINCASTIDSVLYSAGKDVYMEYMTDLFNGEYIHHFYQCTIFNLNADNTMKITKFPPRITIDDAAIAKFWVRYIKNYDLLKDPKYKNLKSKMSGKILVYDRAMNYDSGFRYLMKGIDGIIKMPSVSFKSLEITFFTKNEYEEFEIKNIEFSKIKVKQI